MTDTVSKYLSALESTFRGARDKYEAHRRSGPLMQDIASDPSFVTAVLRRYLETPGSLNTRNYPVVGIDIALNADFGLCMNCWIPLPGGRSDLSTKAVHHHGTMLLSTMTLLGPGYEHWLFTRPTPIDPARDLFSMRAIDCHPHPQGHLAFVPEQTPHLPFYPSGFTITLALWTSNRETTWRDRAKRLPLFRGKEQKIRQLAAKLGLGKALDLKVVSYFDYTPTDQGFHGMRERQEFARGPNEDYLCSLFCVLQQTGNEDLAGVVRQRLTADPAIGNRAMIQQLCDRLERGEQVDGKLSAGHTSVPFANFTRERLVKTLSLIEPVNSPQATALASAPYPSP